MRGHGNLSMAVEISYLSLGLATSWYKFTAEASFGAGGGLARACEGSCRQAADDAPSGARLRRADLYLPLAPFSVSRGS